MNTLYSKIALTLLGLFCFVGIVLGVIAHLATELYQQEITQRLNLDLAAHVISEKPLLKNRQVNQQALEDVFNSMMVINPRIEVYMLDAQGGVLAFFAPHGKVKRKTVDLAPVKTFLRNDKALPILGEDPRDLERRKIFSAAAIPGSNGVAGYLYIILAGEEYEGVVSALKRSYIYKLITWGVVANLAFALLAGLVLFSYLTRRIRKLGGVMEAFKQSDYLGPVRFRSESPPRDEIDHLGYTFDEMAQRMAAQVKQLTQTDRLRRELVANVSHDLRTPLASLQGYLETLLLKGGELTPEDQRRYLEIANRHSLRLGKLVSELFELAKLDSQEAVVHAEPFSLAELVQDTVQRFELAAERKNITIESNFDVQLPFVYADIGLIERVLVNLLENALHYTPDGGIIRLVLNPSRETMSVQVSDTGCGIPTEEIPFIFDRFHRADKPSCENDDGAGLGLSIAQRIIALHGDAISVESMLKRGTTFRFNLPIANTAAG